MIRWSLATAADAAELADFVCADAPARRSDGSLVYDAGLFAEIEAQTGIREGVQFPLPRGEFVVLGRDDDGIACVAWWIEIGGASRLKLLSVGVALRLRRRGLRVGDEMMTEVVARMIDRVAGRDITVIMVHALVHPSNNASAHMLARHGFFYVQESGDYQEWWLRLDVPFDPDELEVL